MDRDRDIFCGERDGEIFCPPPETAAPQAAADDGPRRRESPHKSGGDGSDGAAAAMELGRIRSTLDDRPPLDVEDELAAIDDMDDERDREPEPEILS